MLRWLQMLRQRRGNGDSAIPDMLWNNTLAQLPFLQTIGEEQLLPLRRLTQAFLDNKEFHGASGLQIRDDMAVAIAVQACLPVLHLQQPWRGIAWYDDFVGIVVYPGAMRARRESLDENGVVHQYEEVLTGEAMQDGPVTLSWQDVADAGTSANEGYNVVIHEFVHKIDMRDGAADGCPPLPAGFMGTSGASAARTLWHNTLHTHYLNFCDRLSMAERFGAKMPWLDAYGASAIDEFFAVASEAYFVNRARFGAEFDGLLPLFDAFFRPRRLAE
ncbi:MAG: M90 family metallopeptidase [Betaproteobacteria bacterium]